MFLLLPCVWKHFGQMFRRQAIDALNDYGFSTCDTARVIDGAPDVFAKPADYVETFLGAGKVRAAVYRRDELTAGMQLRSPCIVTEYSSTTLIPSGAYR